VRLNARLLNQCPANIRSTELVDLSEVKARWNKLAPHRVVFRRTGLDPDFRIGEAPQLHARGGQCLSRRLGNQVLAIEVKK
jgi:hypothetical protein